MSETPRLTDAEVEAIAATVDAGSYDDEDAAVLVEQLRRERAAASQAVDEWDRALEALQVERAARAELEAARQRLQAALDEATQTIEARDERIAWLDRALHDRERAARDAVAEVVTALGPWCKEYDNLRGAVMNLRQAQLTAKENAQAAEAREAQLRAVLEDDVLVERLAALEHDRWSRWHKWAVAHWTPERVARWTRLADTPYADIPDEETKEWDRVEARRTVAVMTAALAAPAGGLLDAVREAAGTLELLLDEIALALPDEYDNIHRAAEKARAAHNRLAAALGEDAPDGAGG